MKATTVMILRVSGLDEALKMVRLAAGIQARGDEPRVKADEARGRGQHDGQARGERKRSPAAFGPRGP